MKRNPAMIEITCTADQRLSLTSSLHGNQTRFTMIPILYYG